MTPLFATSTPTRSADYSNAPPSIKSSSTKKARELSKKHTSALACRSLAILYVASALVLGAKKFASFDHRQRKLVAAVSLPLVPLSIAK